MRNTSVLSTTTAAAFFAFLVSASAAFATFSIVAIDLTTGDPKNDKAGMDNALSVQATAAYRKLLQDAAFMAQLPRERR